MNINFPKINFINTIQNSDKKISFTSKPDTFEKSTSIKMKEAMEFARGYCMESVRYDCPKERSVAIDENGNILYKNDGNEGSCHVELDKLKPNTTLIHSHPGETLKPLSPNDVLIFLSVPKMKTIIAIDKNGNTCSMTKPDNFYCHSAEIDTISKEINDLFIKNWLEIMDVPYGLDEKFINYHENLLKENNGITTENIDEIYQQLFGIKKPDNLKQRADLIKYYCTFQGLPYYEPHVFAYMQAKKDNIDPDLDTEIQNIFNKKVASKYGLELTFA